MELNKIHNLDWIEGLKSLPDNSVDCCVTSPPYWGLRDYGVDGQLGLEKTPELFIAKLTAGFEEVRRVLKPTGTLWMNLGDSYCNTPGWGRGGGSTLEGGKESQKQGKHLDRDFGNIKPKDLVGIPWMAAFSLRAAGWYLRQDIIWAKPNPMPESVTDRCTKAHEYIFLMTKSGRYYYDAEAIRTESKNPQDDLRRLTAQTWDNKNVPDDLRNGLRPKKIKVPAGWDRGKGAHGTIHREGRTSAEYQLADVKVGANKRSVWTVPTMPYSDAHFATFPEDLIVDCIKAGSSEYGCCADCGKPYERQTEKSYVKHENWYGTKTEETKNSRGSAGNSYNELVGSATTGWQKTCNCETDLIKPSVILDPFMGAGTTALVAAKLNRNFIGFELNEKYIAIATKRLRDQLGMFNPLRA